MRILHILDHSIPLHSGYSFRTLAILREQRRLGWDTFHLTSPKQKNGAMTEEEVDGYRFFRTPLPPGSLDRIPALGEWRLMRQLERRLEGLVHEVRPDVLHAHSPVLNALPALRIGRRLRLPVVYEVRAFWEDAAVDHGTSRDGGLRYRLTRAIETYALHRADAVTVICQGLRDDIVARGLPAGKVTSIPNAVDVDAFGRGQAPDRQLARELGLEGKRVLGFIGSFYGYEGLTLLLEAVPALLARVPDVRVLLVGGGPDEQRLRALARELRIEDAVRFVGRVPHARVPSYYDLIDILVYPRLSMRLTELVTPLKPLEAMAQGRLVLASDVGGHRELIRDGETGVLFRAGDPEGLAQKAEELLSRPERWPALREAGRRFVEIERNWAASVKRYEEVYGRLLRYR